MNSVLLPPIGEALLKLNDPGFELGMIIFTFALGFLALALWTWKHETG
jgi:hypothetical protein